MNKIKIFGLGGFAENGKNMYVVDIDGSLFILDAGLKYPGQELYGIDEIIPNYKILHRAKKIEGIFISHGHEDHIGALVHILKEINIPIYATNFTMEIIKDSLIDNDFNLDDLTLNTIHPDSMVKFKDARVTFFQTTHSIPESIGIAIHTTEGVICYTSEYTFDQSGDKNYQTDFSKINSLADKKILALLIESIGSQIEKKSNASEQLTQTINQIFKTSEGRMIFSLFSSDLQKIQKVIDLSISHHKKIAIIGRRAQRIVDIAIKLGYLNIPSENLVNLKFITDKIKNDDKDLVCLVTGNRHEPFYMLQRMSKKLDRLIHINDDDTIVLLTPPVPGTEKMAARTIDILYRSEAAIKIIDKKLLSSSHASADEVKMMINFLKPEYIIPIIGQYQHMYHVKKLANELGYSDDNILLMDNGDVFNAYKGETYLSRGDINVSEILIDGTAVGDVNDFVIRDRELLSEDGVLILVSHIDPKNKKIHSEIIVESSGFFYENNEPSIIDQIKELYVEITNKHFEKKYINWNDLKRDIRNQISRFIYEKTKRSPITIPVVSSYDSESSSANN